MSQPCKATASSLGAVKVSRHAQGHLDTGARDPTSRLTVTSQPAQPEPHAAQLASQNADLHLTRSIPPRQKAKHAATILSYINQRQSTEKKK